MPEVFGLIARLLVHDRLLEEYAVQMDDGTTRSCFVVSEENTAFSIELGNQSEYEHIAFEMFVDGIHMDSFLLESDSWKVRSSVKTSSDACKPLIFSEIVTTDSEDTLASPIDLGSIGTIEFHAWWVETVIVREPRENWERNLPSTPISERAKVPTSHRISLGPSTPRERGPMRIVRRIEPDNGPIARFIIRYRPKDLLQAQGIINDMGEDLAQNPLPPNNLKRPAPTEQPTNEECSERARKLRRTSSVALEVKRELSPSRSTETKSELSAAEEVVILRGQVRSMEKRLERLEGERSVKVESSQQSSRVPKQEYLSQRRLVKKEEPFTQGRPFVKREVSPIRLPFPSGEVFDLTDD